MGKNPVPVVWFPYLLIRYDVLYATTYSIRHTATLLKLYWVFALYILYIPVNCIRLLENEVIMAETHMLSTFSFL